MKYLIVLTTLFFTTQLYAEEFEDELDNFTTISVNGNFKLFLKKGEKSHIKVVNNEPELEDDQIEWEVKGGELNVNIKKSIFKKLELEIFVTYTGEISTIDAKRGAWIEVESVLTGNEIELNCSTDGIIKAELDCKTVKASISAAGNGNIRLRGKAENADFKVSTGGFISAVNCKVGDVTAKVSTGGDISCWGTQKMDLKVSTGGTIKYKFDGDNDSDVKQKTVIAGNIEKIKS